MSSKTARLDWREGRRRRAWELKQAGWKQQDIAVALGVSGGAVSQWLARARAKGVEEGRRRHPAPGPAPKLTAEQLAELPARLDHGAEAYGLRGQVWTCPRVGAVIRRPIERATQRDEGAIRVWWEQRWPALKKKPTTKHK